MKNLYSLQFDKRQQPWPTRNDVSRGRSDRISPLVNKTQHPNFAL